MGGPWDCRKLVTVLTAITPRTERKRVMNQKSPSNELEQLGLVVMVSLRHRIGAAKEEQLKYDNR